MNNTLELRAAFSILLLLLHVGLAKIHIVDPKAGTDSSSFKTIQACVTEMKDGDECHIRFCMQTLVEPCSICYLTTVGHHGNYFSRNRKFWSSWELFDRQVDYFSCHESLISIERHYFERHGNFGRIGNHFRRHGSFGRQGTYFSRHAKFRCHRNCCICKLIGHNGNYFGRLFFFF